MFIFSTSNFFFSSHRATFYTNNLIERVSFNFVLLSLPTISKRRDVKFAGVVYNKIVCRYRSSMKLIAMKNFFETNLI